MTTKELLKWYTDDYHYEVVGIVKDYIREKLPPLPTFPRGCEYELVYKIDEEVLKRYSVGDCPSYLVGRVDAFSMLNCNEEIVSEMCAGYKVDINRALKIGTEGMDYLCRKWVLADCVFAVLDDIKEAAAKGESMFSALNTHYDYA